MPGPDRDLKVLALIPSGFCFGLQNLTLAFFAVRPSRTHVHFLNTFWTDGELNRRLDALGIDRSSTWIGMFSRKLDRENLRMTVECLIKLPAAWRDFRRLYRSLRPDLIYVANHHEVILFWPMLIGLRRKVVCHMHDPPPASRFQRVSFAFWRRAVGRFLFISHSARERLSRLGPLGPDDRVIHNGVAIEPLALPRRRSDRLRARFGWPAHCVIVGMTGQINPDKGHDDLLEAASILRQMAPLARLAVGGRGPKEYVAALERQIAERGLQDHVVLSGWVGRAAEFYEAIDVFVLASRHDEGFGLVIAEAGERGVPAIATASGGAAEIVEDGVSGILVAKGDPQALARAIAQLVNDKAARVAMGEAARQRIAAHFDLRTQARQFFAALGEPAGAR
jgi:glycosyltransferase involved in cell wall biosynthesis